MNIARPFIMSLLVSSILITTVHAQKNYDSYPNLEKYYMAVERYHANFIHKLALPGVWGLGFNPEYKIKNLVYATAEAGYGWVISSHEQDFDKKFRGWYSVNIGYPLLDFISSKKGKWVIDRRYEGNMMYDKYYKISVPTHNSLIVVAGYASEPTTTKIHPVNSGPVVQYSFQAPVFEFGVKFIRQSKTRVKVNDYSGPTQRRFVIYAGVIIPAKDEIITPESYRNLPKFTRPGYELSFSIPFRLNGWATFDIGIKSIGYSNEDDIAQLYFGNTFYIK